MIFHFDLEMRDLYQNSVVLAVYLLFSVSCFFTVHEHYLLGYRDGDSGHILENIVYFELLRQGYDVAIGKIDNQEVDFIATKADVKKYIQVTENMNAPETRKRELAPLRKIRDNYEKLVIALECDLMQTQDGIRIQSVLDFLLK